MNHGLFERIIEQLKDPKNHRTIRIGDGPNSVCYVLSPEDIKDLERIFAVAKAIELLPLKELIVSSIEKYAKNINQ